MGKMKQQKSILLEVTIKEKSGKNYLSFSGSGIVTNKIGAKEIINNMVKSLMDYLEEKNG